MRRAPILLLVGATLALLPGCRGYGPACVRAEAAAVRAGPPTAASPTVTAPAAPILAGPRRSAAELEEGFRRSREGKAFLTPLSNEEAHAAMPGLFKGREFPNLLLVSGHQPKTSEALMAMAKAMRTEGSLDAGLLNDVFWAVSSENECFY